ncbi:MAG: hypothetical protein ACKVU4_09915 [Phycisphaerales bacterium]
MSRLLDVYRTLPRAARWGVLALAGVLAYFVVVEPVMDQTNAWASKANARADAIALVRSGGGAEDDAVSLGLKQFGNVLPPGDPRERAVAFHTKVLEVIEKHGVKNHTSTNRNAPLSRGPLLTALAPANTVDRLIREVKFEATPETLAAVIADLERTPEVAAVTRVQVRKGENGRMVQATIDAEAWVLAKGNAGR